MPVHLGEYLEELLADAAHEELLELTAKWARLAISAQPHPAAVALLPHFDVLERGNPSAGKSVV